MRPRAALFDLDDTLIGRDVAFAATARAFYDQQPAVHESTAWDAASKFIDSLSPHGTIDAQAAALQLKDRWPALDIEPVSFEAWFFQTLASHAKPLPGVVEMLNELNEINYPWGVVTNGKKFQLVKLEKSGLVDLIPFSVISRLFGADKPDPRIYYAALDRLKASFEGIEGITAGDVIFVGDNVYTDITGALEVGMRTAWVQTDYDYPAVLPEPDLTIDSVVELRPVLGLPSSTA